MTDNKRAKITQEHKREAELLLALWKAKAGRRSQAEFGEHYDLGNQANVGHYLHGRSALNAKAAAAFAAELGCKVEDFSPRVAGLLHQLSSSSPQPQPAPSAPEHSGDVPEKTHLVSESQWQLLQDFDLLIPEEQHAIRKTLKEKAEYAKKVYMQFTNKNNVPPPVSDKRIEEAFGTVPGTLKKNT